MDIATRQRLAAERILENESLREGLEEAGAEALLKWAIACAQQIAGETTGIEDDEEADEASYPRMRALRQMLEAVKSLHQPELNPVEGRALLTELVESASVVYGPGQPTPERIFWNVFLATLQGDSGQKINALRALVEPVIKSEGE